MKFLASIALLFCMTNATLCAPSLDTTSAMVAQSVEAKIVLDAPLSARIGELVRLDVSGSTADSFKWLLVPESVDFLVYDAGARAVFSARAAGEYRFIVACAKDGAVDVVTHLIRIVGPPPEPMTDNLAEWIPFWLWTHEMPEAECLALAASFEEIATRKDDFDGSGDWIKATAKANREVLGDRLEAWKPLLDKIGAKLIARAESGLLATPEDHAETWNEVARGLKNS